MQKDKEDLRIKRTRKYLCNALFDLLQKNSFDKLSINDICNKAMVHRSTFYNHFTDKNDLLNYALDDIQEEMFEKTIKEGRHQSPKAILMSLISNTIDYINENHQKLVLIFENSAEKMTTMIASSTKRSISYLISKIEYPQDCIIPKELVISFYTGGITLVGIEWLKSKEPCNKDKALEYFNVLLDECIFIKNN